MRLAEQRIIPFLAGYGGDHDLDDLIADAVHQAKIHYRANAWGMGVANTYRGDNFDAFLHLWGRPFFITADDPQTVAETVLRYRNCALHEVDELARSQIALLDPALLRHVEPDMEGVLPADERLAIGFRWKLDLLREAGTAVRAGRKTIRDPAGDKVPAADALTGNAQFCLVEFFAALLPGWIERGRVWPTELGAPLDDNAPLLGSLRTEFPSLDWQSNWTIPGNYEIGGYAAASDVRPLRDWLSDNAEALAAVGDQWDDRPYVQKAVRKIDEALALAELTGSGFVEAAEIYIPIEGVVN